MIDALSDGVRLGISMLRNMFEGGVRRTLMQVNSFLLGGVSIFLSVHVVCNEPIKNRDSRMVQIFVVVDATC